MNISDHTWEVIAWTTFGVNWLIRIVLTLRIILRRTPVPQSLSWLVMVWVFPILGLFIYALIGESRLGSRRVKRAIEVMTALRAKGAENWPPHAVEDPGGDQPDLTELARLCTRVAGKPPLRGNEIELLDDANLVLKLLVADIEAAQHHVHLLFYIWMPTNGGARVAEAVARAAARGVTCRVLVDSAGGRAFWKSSLPNMMRSAGAKVEHALYVRWWRAVLARIDLRNHRKIAVIDGTLAYTGSQNLTDETFRSRRTRKIGPWIDAMVRIRGPAAKALQSVFLSDWQLDTDEDLGDLAPYFPLIEPRPGPIVHVLPSGPGAEPDAIHQAVLAMIFAARRELVMVTPYFVPDEATKVALINACLRGVEVTLILPDHLDMPLVAAASRSHFEDLMDAGVKIACHCEGLLHAKSFVVDQRLAVIGSMNFDMRSFWLNFEVTLFIYDEPFARELRALSQRYLDESEMLDLATWRTRSVTRRFLDNSAQLLGPLL
mgnify:CR=1 FL=1